MLQKDFRTLLDPANPPELGPGPRPGVLSAHNVEWEVKKVIEGSALPETAQQLIRATFLLWHDQLDQAHSISQEIETSDGSYVHGIIHRREPDYSNARYWFNRVGVHPCFPELARRVRPIFSTAKSSLPHALTTSDTWDPFAFIDACRTASKAKDSQEAVLLREVQAQELLLLLEHFRKE